MWRLPDHCAQGLQMAGRSLRINRSRDFWAGDLLQAGTVALWQHAPGCKSLAYSVAKRAMTDELRRLTPGERQVTGRAKMVQIVQQCERERPDEWLAEKVLDGWQDPRTDEDTPEAMLQARQTLARLEALAPGWPAALALADDLRDAGRRQGVSESRACQVRRWLQVSAA